MNYVGEAAQPDGLTALCGATNPLLQLLKEPLLFAFFSEHGLLFMLQHF